MEPKKNPKFDTTRQIPVYTMIGLVVALLMVISAFEWSHSDKVEVEEEIVGTLTTDDEEEVLEEIPMTVQVPPPPTPVIQQPILVEVPDEEELEEEVVVKDAEEDAVINTNAPTDNLPKPKAFKGKPKPKPKPKVVIDNTIHDYVDEQPKFPGGEEAFMKYVKSKLVYPRLAKTRNIQGKVFVSFVVEKDGSLTDIKLVRGIGGGCDEAAINVVKNCPKWKPGKQRFKPVRVKMALPIFFKLRK